MRPQEGTQGHAPAAHASAPSLFPAQGSQVPASRAASVVAPSTVQVSAPLAPFPPVVHAQKPAAQVQPPTVQAESSSTSVKKNSSAKEKGVGPRVGNLEGG
ncbi:hypothetical protein U1Q18_038033 [Sarracenia purpurea var. burkii]